MKRSIFLVNAFHLRPLQQEHVGTALFLGTIKSTESLRRPPRYVSEVETSSSAPLFARTHPERAEQQ